MQFVFKKYMKQKLYITSLGFFLVMLIGCSDRNEFQEEVRSFVKNDDQIDQGEYEILKESVLQADDARLKNITDENGVIEDAKLRAEILRAAKRENPRITENAIWQAKSKVTPKKFNINVYVENSASMDGYVQGNTDFETTVYDLLMDFKISDLCDSLNLNYINNSIPYTKSNALQPDISDFIERLEPTTFRKRGGNRGTSDISNILKQVSNEVDHNNISVLISDFVFSPGKHKNAVEYLNGQQIGIRGIFDEKIKKMNLSTVIIQCESNFNGTYYDKTDSPIPLLKCTRPYYIWLIGTNEQIRSIIKSEKINVKGGYKNRLILVSGDKKHKTPYKILINPKIGEFKLKNGAQGPIENAERNRERLFGFNVVTDYSKCIQGLDYFSDAGNYKLSNKAYNIKVETIPVDDNSVNRGYTHKLKLQTSELRTEKLRVNVTGKVPQWVYSASSLNDSGIKNNTSEQAKTFGFKFLVEGVCEAYYPTEQSKIISSFDISINQ